MSISVIAERYGWEALRDLTLPDMQMHLRIIRRNRAIDDLRMMQAVSIVNLKKNYRISIIKQLQAESKIPLVGQKRSDERQAKELEAFFDKHPRFKK